MTHSLSKSQYIKGLQCPKRLWFYRHRKDLALPVDPATQARFDAGNEIGHLATRYFDGGVEVTNEYWDIKGAVKTTEKFIAEGHEVIYEATALHPVNGGYCRIDILRKIPGTDEWELIEVKSSTKVKPTHIDDMSFQYHVFYHAGYKIRRCFMMLVNNEYVRQGNINPQGLFRLEDISEQVFARQGEVEHMAAQLAYVLERKKEPDAEIGARCFDPHECEYRQHCWKNVPDYSIYNIYQKEKAEVVSKQIGSCNIGDIPPTLFPGNKKDVDVACYQNNGTHIKKDEVKTFLSGLNYPLYFLDYETVDGAVPLYDGTRPYQKIPFQFSLHVQKSPDAEIQHFEYLHKEPTDPRAPLTEALVSLCGNSGSIIVYYQTFEKGRNKELAEAFPAHADKLYAINNRIVDLWEPFTKRWLYHPAQRGSASIKDVLPAHTDISYKGLDIAGGGDASFRYFTFVKALLPEKEQHALWNSLTEYCKLDTYAMVMLLDVLLNASLD